MGSGRSLGQFIRFVIVGLLSNALLYVGYIALTAVGVGPKVAMTLLYALGAVQAFLFNKHWSFRSRKSHGPEFVRYALAYAFGYVLNLAGLMMLVDVWGLPHRIVQGGLIIFVALVMFALQKFWVFKDRNPLNSEPAV